MTPARIRASLAFLSGVAVIFAPSAVAFACSVVFWNSNPTTLVVSRTMDWNVQFVDELRALPRGMQRSGAPADNPAQWASRYGSVVVAENDLAIVDGVNEAGLAAHVLYMAETDYPTRDPAVPGLAYNLWIQYYLDNFATVADVVAHLGDVQVVPIPSPPYPTFPLHVAVEDATGDSAVIEFVNGALLLHHGRQYNVMTNDPPMNVQLANLQRYQAFGGTIPDLPGGILPQDRFVRASYYLQHLPQTQSAPEAIAYVTGIAENVSVPFGAPYDDAVASTYPTWWRTAIDLTNRVYYFRSTLEPGAIWVNLANLDLSEGAPALRLDPANSALAGEVSGAFVPMTPGF